MCRSTFVSALFFLCLVAFAPATQAASFVKEDPADTILAQTDNYRILRHEEDGFTVIIVEGGIVSPMAADLRRAFDAIPADRRVLLDLDSPGGERHEGDSIVDLIHGEQHRRKVDTLVYYAHQCSSMCIAVFMAGINRYAAPASAWMFHPATSGANPRPDPRATAAYLRGLLALGVSETYLKKLSAEGVFTTPSEYWTTGAELYVSNAGIVTKLLSQIHAVPVPQIAMTGMIRPR